MGASKPPLKITSGEWEAVRATGRALLVFNRPYIVTTDEATHEPIYQPVAILGLEPRQAAEGVPASTDGKPASTR